MKKNIHITLRIFLSLPLLTLVMSCNLEDSNIDFENNSGFAVDVVSLKQATSQDVPEYTIECPESEGDNICVLFCHIPPGNPLALHTKILPLQATVAHLSHEGLHSDYQDYFGECSGLLPNDDTDPSDSGEGDSGGDNPEDDSNDDAEDEVPAWCEENTEIDSDCDGFDDVTGEPLY